MAVNVERFECSAIVLKTKVTVGPLSYKRRTINVLFDEKATSRSGFFGFEAVVITGTQTIDAGERAVC